MICSEENLFPQRTSVCRLCDAPLLSIIDLGEQPIAQDFASPDDAGNGLAYRLEPGMCSACGLVQLMELPPSEVQFTKSYAYRAGVSAWMRKHLRELAEKVKDLVQSSPDPFVVEIGCNDGTFLAPLVEAGIRHLGIDPAAEAVASAQQNGASAQVERFSEQIALALREQMGQADAIVAVNVIAHIRNLRDTARAIKHLLAPNGVFVFEAVYLGDILQNTAFDQFYDEHVYSFSCTTAQAAFAHVGLELINVETSPNQGGSMIYTFAHPGARPRAAIVDQTLVEEARRAYHQPETWAMFADRCEGIKQELNETLLALSQKGARISGYGATAKSATVIQYCGLSNQLLDFVYDTTPGKIGKTTPHSHIPIRHADHIQAGEVEYLLLFAWNHRHEIENREAAFAKMGGKWINYVPSVHTS